MDATIQGVLLRAGFQPSMSAACLVTTTPLGRGSFGAVVTAFHVLPDGLFERIAVKRIDLNVAAAPQHVLSCVTDLIREVHFHHILADCRHVLPLKGTCWFSPRRGTISIPMALCSGNLLDYVARVKFRFRPGVLYMLFKQCLCAMYDIHAKDIVHRDIKPENVLVQPGPTPQDTPLLLLADFGLSRHAADLRTPHSPAGTPAFMSLEACGSAGHTHPHAVDVWAMACAFFFLLSGQYPFEGRTELEVMRSIQVGVRRVDTSVLGSDLAGSDEVRVLVPLVLSMLNPDPAQRPTAAQLLRNLNMALAILNASTVSSIRIQQEVLDQIESSDAAHTRSPHYTRMIVCRPNHAVPIYTGTDMYAAHTYTGVSVQPGRDVLADLEAAPVPGGPVTAPIRSSLSPPCLRDVGSARAGGISAASSPILPTVSRSASPSPLRTAGMPTVVEWVRIVYPLPGFVPCREYGQHLLHKVHGACAATLCAPLVPLKLPSAQSTPLRRGISATNNAGSTPLGSRTPLPQASPLPLPLQSLASPSPHRTEAVLETPLALPLFTADDDEPLLETSTASPTVRMTPPGPQGDRRTTSRVRSTFARLFSRSRSKE